jgi:uncharacterized RDD family membrane protein YckC
MSSTDPYSPPQVDLATGLSGEPAYAGFGLRLGASIIDMLILLPLLYGLGYAIYGSAYFSSASVFKGTADFFIQIILPMVLTLVLWHYLSATPGKQVLGLKIVDAKTLKKPSTGQFVLRYFSYFISMLPLGFGFLWIIFDKRKQAFHDKIARTLIVRNR